MLFSGNELSHVVFGLNHLIKYSYSKQRGKQITTVELGDQLIH